MSKYCEICQYDHKIRPKEFCRALNAPGGLNKNLDINQFMNEFMELKFE
jgi:hypothetical protein